MVVLEFDWASESWSFGGVSGGSAPVVVGVSGGSAPVTRSFLQLVSALLVLFSVFGLVVVPLCVDGFLLLWDSVSGLVLAWFYLWSPSYGCNIALDLVYQVFRCPFKKK